MKTVTFSKGGTLEKTVPLNQVQIPDLWHIQSRLRETDPESAEAVLRTWHIAHDLLSTLRGEQ